MTISKLSLSCLILAISISIGYSIPLSTPCTTEEIVSPLTNIHKYIENMRPDDADIDKEMKQLQEEVNAVPAHIEHIKTTCGDEKTEGVERLEKFMASTQIIEDIISAIDSGDKEKAKTLLEPIKCEHMIEFIIRKYATDTEKIEKILDVISIIDDMNLINMMNEGILYILDDSNIMVTAKMVPMMKEQIAANTDKAEPDVIAAAKLTMKEIIKRTIPHCYEGLIVLDSIDSNLADQAMYEAIFQNFTYHSIYSPTFKLVKGAPNMHMKVIGLQAIFDKIGVLEMKDSVLAAKIMIIANKILEKEEIAQDETLKEKLNTIIGDMSVFVKKLTDGYSCQEIDQIKAIMDGQPIQHVEHNDYMIFYNPTKDEKISNGKFIAKEDGDMMMYTAKYDHIGGMIISVLLDKAEYPEKFSLTGEIISKKTIAKEPITDEEVCAMDPKPDSFLCVPMTEVLLWEKDEADKQVHSMYEKYQEHIKNCIST